MAFQVREGKYLLGDEPKMGNRVILNMGTPNVSKWKWEVKKRNYYLAFSSHLFTDLFISNDDYSEFLKLLSQYKRRFGFKVFGFCLLKDSIHLIFEGDGLECVNTLIKEIRVRYARYYNHKYRRSKQVWHDEYILEVLRNEIETRDKLMEVEMMPVKKRLSASPIYYEWGSCFYRVMGSHSLLDQFEFICDNKSIY